jgi:hypothetical protein
MHRSAVGRRVWGSSTACQLGLFTRLDKYICGERFQAIDRQPFVHPEEGASHYNAFGSFKPQTTRLEARKTSTGSSQSLITLARDLRASTIKRIQPSTSLNGMWLGSPV